VAGASARTIQRLFLAEAGLEAGNAGTSAFTAAFRKHFGFTPSQLA